MSTQTAPSMPPSLEVQFRAYELGLKETDQIIAIQSHTATVATTFLVVTGAVWAAMFAKEISVPAPAAAAVLLLHILACLPTLQILVSNTHAINLRFAFHRHFSPRYFPDIEGIGQQAFRDVYASPQSIRAKYLRWGRCPWLWYFIPIAGLCGSAYLLMLRLPFLVPGGGA